MNEQEEKTKCEIFVIKNSRRKAKNNLILQPSTSAETILSYNETEAAQTKEIELFMSQIYKLIFF